MFLNQKGAQIALKYSAPLGSPLPRVSPQLKRFTATRERRKIALDERHASSSRRHPLSINDLYPTHFDRN